jgi:CPA2 family monovalent cation:H+ antiporter-2
VVFIGYKLTTYLLKQVARTRSHELFTLTILALIFLIATSSSFLFGISIALGAFIAGMVIGQTEARHQASVNSLPLKDMFLVIFFLSTGMLFNPMTIMNFFPLFLGILAIILLVKPLVAFLIITLLKYPVKTAVTVSLALAQIGEFSFILAEQALKFELLPEEGFDLIIACAIISIAINPTLFKCIEFASGYLEKKCSLLPNKRSTKKLQPTRRSCLVIGFGSIGKALVKSVESLGFTPTIIDINMDIVSFLIDGKKNAIYGDARQTQLLQEAQIMTAEIVIIAISDANITKDIIKTAHQLNSKAHVWVQAQYASDRQEFYELGAHVICSEDETVKAFETALFRRP